MTFRMLLTSRARVAWLVVAVLLAVAVGALLAPLPARLGGGTTGDADLAAQVRAVTSGKQRLGLSVAVLDEGKLRQAGLGDTGTGATVTTGTPFEIGSVGKTLTASVLADMIADGVVEPDDTVREVLPEREWKRGSVGDATLAELASQRSGLPRAPLTPRTYLDAVGYTFLGTNPDTGSPADVIDAAAGAPRYTKGEYAYSNLGFAFLGHVLAEKEGKPYPELLRERVLDPLRLDATVVPPTVDDVPDGAVAGHDGSGRELDPAVSDGDAPAGAGVWSTTGDMARFADAVMRGEAPGADAAKPRYPAGEDRRIGYAWHVNRTKDGGSVVWHNGQAGGCTAFVGFDRAKERVVVVLNNTDANVDALAMRLLTGSGETDSGSSPMLPGVIVGAGLPPFAGLSLLGAALGGWRRAKRGQPDRAGIVGNAGWAVFSFAIAYAAGALSLPTTLGWLVGAALAGVAVFTAVARWRELGWNTAKRPRLHWLGTAVGVLVGVVTAVAVAG